MKAKKLINNLFMRKRFSIAVLLWLFGSFHWLYLKRPILFLTSITIYYSLAYYWLYLGRSTDYLVGLFIVYVSQIIFIPSAVQKVNNKSSII